MNAQNFIQSAEAASGNRVLHCLRGRMGDILTMKVCTDSKLNHITFHSEPPVLSSID